MTYEITKSETFNKWLKNLKDKPSAARILSRLYRVEQGNLGDYKIISGNLFELRFFFGSGYRIYFTIKNNEIVILLCGGDKSSQDKDIAIAKKMIDEWE